MRRPMLTRRAALAALASVFAGCDEPRSAPGQLLPSSAPPQPPTTPPPTASTPSLDPATASSTASDRPPTQPPPSATTPRKGGELRSRVIEVTAIDSAFRRAVIAVPDWGADGEKFPLLVALHGLGESRKGPDLGPWGWVKDYWLDRAARRLRSPPLKNADFQGFVSPKRLAKINASLEERPFRGLVVACPFTPDLLEKRSLDNAGPFAQFVASSLIPKVREEAPALAGREATGIDGVSLGGRLSLLVALEQPGSFGAVGVMQGAFEPNEIEEVAGRTLTRHPLGDGVPTLHAQEQKGAFRLRLLTSEGDYYRTATALLHKALSSRGVAHEHILLPGPHDYVFNRGPGAIEMLLWHDRALRGEAPDL